MLPPGTTLPEFTVLDHEGRPLHSRHLGGGWTVLWWYVKADTPG